MKERGCSGVHADAQRYDAEMELDRDKLLVRNNNRDWLREKALYFRLD